MSRPRLYLDEDAMQQGLVIALRARRIDIVTADEAGMLNKSDEDHLHWAAAEGRVLFSFNIADYYALHFRWIASGRVHAGIILGPQQRYSVGEQLRRLLAILNKRTAAEIQSKIEYLSAWQR